MKVAASVGAAALVAAALVLGPARRGDADALHERAAGLGEIPVAFVPNRGQWDEEVLFSAWHEDVAAAFSRDGIRVSRPDGPTVGLTFRGASRSTRIEGKGERAGRYNFVFGADPSEWRTGLPGFEGLSYQGLYNGIDLAIGDRDGLAYDVLVAPGADHRRFTVDVEGARRLAVGEDGALRLHTQLGTLRQAPPVAWEVLPSGERRRIESGFELRGERTYGFWVRAHDPSRPLVIDPGVDWATFLGGAGDESIRGLEIARDGTGDVVVAGQTASPDFPHTRGNLRPIGWTPYVARLNASGTELVYSTFFGGSFNHSVQDVGLDSQSRPAVVGDTNSLDFPTTPGALDRTPGNGMNGDYDAYVIKFEADGSGPVFGTYLGGAAGSGVEQAWRVLFDASDAPIVAGITGSPSFPTTPGAYDRALGNGGAGPLQDVFISRLSPGGSQLTYSTYFGGDGLEDVYDLVIDPQGVLSFGGKVSNFPDQPGLMPTTPDAFDRTFDDGGSTPEIDGYLARLKPDAAGAADLRYATFLGGHQYREAVTGIALDPTDPSSVTVAGWTYSGDFPTTPGAWLRTHFRPIDAPMTFVSRFRFPSGAASSLQWSTFYGAPGGQNADDVAVDAQGRPIFVGSTGASNPTTTDRAFDRVPGAGAYVGSADGYVARLSADGARNEYMTLLGGSENDEIAQHVAYLGGNSVYVAGLTDSTDFPVTPGAYDTVYGHDGKPSDASAPGTTTNDAFVARLTLEEQPTADTTPPPAPQLKGPAVGTRMTAHVLSATFDWSDVEDASGVEAYQLQVSPNAEFADTGSIKWWEPWMPTSIAVKDFSISQTGSYWWRVRALDGAGNLGPWSSVWTFTVDDPAPPAAPTLASPPNGGRFAPGNIVFDWSPAARAKFYEIQVDTTSSFSNANRTWLRGISATRQTISLSSERRYWWRVRASNDALSAGPWSTVWSLEIKRGSPAAPVPAPDTDPVSGGGTPAPAGTQVAPFSQTELALTGAQSGTLTVNLNGPAPTGGATVRISSNYPQYVSAPASVTIPAGQSSAPITVTASNRVRLRQVVISASYGGGQDHGVLVTSYGGVASPSLYGMSVNGTNVSSGTGTQGRTSFAGGRSVQGTVAFTPGWVAPPGGAIVKLGSTDPTLAQVPDQVVVPGGQNSASFTVTTTAVSAVSYVTILASRSMTHRVELELLPQATLSSLTLTPTVVNGGEPSTGTVALASAAPAGGVEVTLASSDTRWAVVPATVTVPAGATSATFTVTTSNTSGEGQSSVITASAGGITRQQSLGVNPPPAATPNALSSFVLDPATVEGGQSSTGRVTLATAAPSGGTRVDIFVNSGLASAPPFVTVPAGQTATTFTISTQPHQGLDQLVSIAIGTVNSSREATLRVTQTTSTPPTATPSAVSLSPSTVTGGQSSSGTVTLTAAAPAGGLVVALASSNPPAATVPASVTVAQGATSASFAVATSTGTTTRTATITASANGVSRSATLTVSASAGTGTVSITRAEYNDGRLRIEATSSPSGTLTAYVTSTGQLIGTLSSGRLEVNWPSNPGSVTVKSTNGGQATRTVTT